MADLREAARAALLLIESANDGAFTRGETVHGYGNEGEHHALGVADALRSALDAPQGGPAWRDSFPPTHYCKECRALWRRWPDGSWSLVTMSCGKCCDNVPMGEQIVALADPALSPDQQAVAEELAHLGKCAVALDAAMGRADPWAKPERDTFQAALRSFGHLMIDCATRKRLAREGGA